MSRTAARVPDTVPRHAPARAALTVGALGVVFGDIGTSPIYTIQTLFNPEDPHPVAVSATSVFGLVSLIFWSVTIIVTIKYVLLVMRADNDGEGGILSLITLITRRGAPGVTRTKLALAALGVFGASLFFGDSLITPAISVLSAVEGLEVVEPSLEPLIVPITAFIILLLFLVQRFGTGRMGRFFGPVMIVWFTVIAACGVGGILQHPQVLEALSPTYALSFLVGQFPTAFFALAAVVLAITGAEALYADLGHFGRAPITRAWLIMVFPACILSYLGQAALVLNDPARALANPFFLLVPQWGRLPMVLLATAATVIASQAVISGAFSVAHQAVQLGYLPRLAVRHTSAETAGQIYVPWVNWALLIGVLVLVFSFRSSTALAYAFGMAVTGTVVITTILFFYLAREQWRRPLGLVIAGAAFFLVIEGLFLAANFTKLTHGAWLPLLIALVVFTLMTTWQRGRTLLMAHREHDEGSLQDFVDDINSRRPGLVSVPGTAVFLNRSNHTAPLALRANVAHNHVLHEQVVIVTVETRPVPYVSEADRVEYDDLGHAGDGISHIAARFGYMQRPDVPAALALAVRRGLGDHLHPDDATYFLSSIDVYATQAPGMARWRKQIYLAASRVTSDAAEYFSLPRDRTLIIGSRIGV
jgi:KUP system potassium uptake protein